VSAELDFLHGHFLAELKADTNNKGEVWPCSSLDLWTYPTEWHSFRYLAIILTRSRNTTVDFLLFEGSSEHTRVERCLCDRSRLGRVGHTKGQTRYCCWGAMHRITKQVKALYTQLDPAIRTTDVESQRMRCLGHIFLEPSREGLFCLEQVQIPSSSSRIT
jgi:hypothetical protein